MGGSNSSIGEVASGAHAPDLPPQFSPRFGTERDYDVPRMQIRPNDIVVDIGANQGVFTCYAAYHGARVYAFEPFPQSFETLQENVREQWIRKECYGQALGDRRTERDGKSHLH